MSILALNKVNYSYKNGKKVLNDISYCISNNNSPVLFEVRI